MNRPTRTDLRECILHFLEQRGPSKTICPSEVARALGGNDWRSFMNEVRDAAAILQREGLLETLQKGKPVEPTTARGPIRLRLVRSSSQ